MRVAGGMLLASAWIYDSKGPTVSGAGVSAHSLDGSPRFHVLGRSAVDVLGARNGLAYAIHDGVAVIDPATGRVAGTSARRDVYLLTDE